MSAFGQERPTDWLSAERLESLPDTVFFHARNKLSESLRSGKFEMLSALAAHVGAAGWGVEVVTFAPDGQDRALDYPRHLHIFMDDRAAYGANAIHCVPSYLPGFWYFDEIGSRNNSLMRLAKFEPRAIGAQFAQEFHTRLVSRFIATNRSKFEQEPRGAVAIEAGCLVFFAQDFKPPRNHRHFLTVPQMIEAAIAAKGARRLYIKPHPNQGFDEVEAMARYHAPEAGVEVTHASIHDLLAAADCALTLTSAVGFEAFLHKTPVVLGGQTDFWQNAITLTDPGQMVQAMAAALGREWPYEKFLLWYLRQMCVDGTAKALPKVLEKLHRKGFSFGGPGRGFF
jgi:hypothetical protein